MSDVSEKENTVALPENTVCTYCTHTYTDSDFSLVHNIRVTRERLIPKSICTDSFSLISDTFAHKKVFRVRLGGSSPTAPFTTIARNCTPTRPYRKESLFLISLRVWTIPRKGRTILRCTWGSVVTRDTTPGLESTWYALRL